MYVDHNNLTMKKNNHIVSVDCCWYIHTYRLTLL